MSPITLTSTRARPARKRRIKIPGILSRDLGLRASPMDSPHLLKEGLGTFRRLVDLRGAVVTLADAEALEDLHGLSQILLERSDMLGEAFDGFLLADLNGA